MSIPLLKTQSNLKLCILGVMLIGALSACASIETTVKDAATSLGIIDHSEVKPPTTEAPPLFRQGMASLAEAKYEDALVTFAKFLGETPTSPWTQATQLNMGRAYEGLQRWSEATEKYRGVAQVTGTSAPRLQTMALYRLSFCYEAVGENQATVAALKDVFPRQKNLPPEVARAELPARLAAAYARVGAFNEAVEYYKLAETGVAKLRQEVSPGAVPEWLPRTFFYMGHLSLQRVDWADFETALRPLARGQTYLLQAAELGREPWATQAADELISRYQELWNVIDAQPTPSMSDPILARRTLQEAQWERSLLLLDHLNRLRAWQRPSAQPGSAEVRIFTQLQSVEQNIARILAQRPAGEGLTPESLQRQQALRGRVLIPNDTLEKEFLRATQNRQSPPQSLPLKKQDPNL